MSEQMSRNVPNFPGGENDLSDKQRLAVELLVAGRSMTGTAEALGIDRRTLFRWREDESFREILSQRRRELRSIAGERLGALLEPALDVLEAQLKDVRPRPFPRRRGDPALGAGGRVSF